MSEMFILSIEKKIHRAAMMPEPSKDFQDRLWDQLRTHHNQPDTRTHIHVLRRHPAWIVIAALLIVFIALFIGFGPRNVYAFFRQILGIGDAGIQSIQEVGLVTDLELTTVPTLIPDESASAITPHNATVVALSETHEGVTLTLDWVYVDEGRLALSWTTGTLPEDLTYGIPAISMNGYTTPQAEGNIQTLRKENNQLIFVSYQVIQVDTVGEAFGFNVDLPLVRKNEQSDESLALFHFELQDIPVFRGRTVPLQQTYAHQINGIELRLESIQMTPSSTELVVCNDYPTDDGSHWTLQNATLQMGDGTEENNLSYSVLDESSDGTCVQFTFETSSDAGAKHMTFRVYELVNETSEEVMTGLWNFYIDLPTTEDFNTEVSETPEPTPTEIGSQTVSDVTVTLEWVFVDALRAAVGYTITGLPDVPEAVGVQGNIHLYDMEGNEVGGAGIGTSNVVRVDDQPGAVQGTWSVGFMTPLEQTEASFQLSITLGSTQQYEYIAGFPISPEATPYPAGEQPPSLPDQFLGTYVFDFTTPIQPLTVLTNIPTVTVNGIEVIVPRAELTASMSKVMICYQKPSERDWWIFDAVVSDGTDESHMSGGQVLYDPDVSVYSGYNTENWQIPAEFQTVEHGRCLLLDFLQGKDQSSGILTLIIPALEISPPEVIPDAELEAAYVILEAQGIEMSYEIYRGSGGGGGGVTYTTLPEGMTDEEAYQKFLEALGYLYEGPWEIPLINQE